MPNFLNWMGEDGKAGAWAASVHGANTSAHITHRIISDKPQQIEIVRHNQTLAPQTVRIETTRIAPDRDTMFAGRENNANAVLIGYKDHPTIPDTDIRAGDRFALNGSRYEVRFIFPETPGSIQAWLEVIN